MDKVLIIIGAATERLSGKCQTKAWRKYGTRVKKKGTKSKQVLLVNLVVTLSVGYLTIGCGADDQIEYDLPVRGPDFGHGSPRPQSSYTIDPDRVPYAMPQVVSSDWSEPIKLPTLNTPAPADAITITPDGRRLYFYWSPMVGAPYSELLHGTTGTYFADRVGDDPGHFENPRFFDLRQDTDGACDGRLSFTPEGDYVYFHSTRAANTGFQKQPPTNDYLDIYVARIVDGVPGPVRNLGEPVNIPYLDGEHGLSPDGTKLYFTSDRPGGLGGTDIWVSTKSGDTWNEPVNIGEPINTVHNEGQPQFAAGDPNTMFFVSNRIGPSSIFRSIYDGDKWSEPECIITGYVGEPTLIEDGSILYFVHVLVDQKGVFGADIWYVRRMGSRFNY